MAKVDIYPAFTASGVKVTSAVGDGPTGVRFEWPDGHALFTDLPEQGMYLDACDGVSGPVAIVTGHDTDTAYLVTPNGFETLAKTHGIRACAVNIVNGSFRWVFVHNTTHYIDTGEVKPLPPDQIQTSQGILALEPSGRINWAAPPDRVEDGLFHKVNAGPVSAGLLAQRDQLTVLDDSTKHTIFNGLCHNIRIVERTDGRYGVCARNEGSPIFSVGPPWPDFIDPSEPPDPPDPPDPEEPEEPDEPDPEPEPEEPRMIYFSQAKQSGDAKEITSRMKVWGERVPHSSGGFGVKKPNGKFATLTPSGQWEERDAILGHWELFFDVKPAGTLAPRHDPQVVFYLETYEA